MPSWQLQQALEAHQQQQRQQVPAGGSSTADQASQDVATASNSSGTAGEALGAGHWAAALWERVQCLEARNR
jgi:hypothetical protein